MTGGHRDAERLTRIPEAELRQLFAALRARYHYIIVDAAALSASPFSSVLARNADGVFLAVSVGQTERDAVRESVDQMNRRGAHLLGVVVLRTESR